MGIKSLKLKGLSAKHFSPEKKSYPYPLLFIHGMWGGKWQWDQYAQLAYDRGFECYTVDLRGHHESSADHEDLGEMSVKDHINDLKEIVGRLGRVVFIGHSMGGLIAQSLVTLSPGSRCAVFIASAAPKGISVLSYKLATRMVNPHYIKAMWGNHAFKPLWKDARELLYNCLNNEGASAAYRGLTFESGKIARELALSSIVVDHSLIDCTTLVVSPKEDCLISPRVQKKIAKRYGSDFLEVQGGHMIVTSEKGGNTMKAILDWVRSRSTS